jgi:hypothetical protein
MYKNCAKAVCTLCSATEPSREGLITLYLNAVYALFAS